LEVNTTLGIGGRYGNSPMRHRNSNTETLDEYLTSRGFNIAAEVAYAGIFVAIDHTDQDIPLLMERKRNGKFSVLFRSEPRCVLPEAYKKETEDLYDEIICFGQPEKNAKSSHWPQYWQQGEPFEQTDFGRSDRTAMINANKLSLSRSELYTLRRKCAAEIGSLDLFGEGWNASTLTKSKTLLIEILKDPTTHLFTMWKHLRYWFKPWRSTLAPTSKQGILRSYKYTLVIENDRTYMSEKLFDALASGCIPIYVGPAVIDYEIPKGLVIEVEPTVKGVVAGMEAAGKLNFSDFQRKLYSWLTSEETERKHLGPYVVDRAIGRVFEDYNEFNKQT
jgi:hypothetical protein